MNPTSTVRPSHVRYLIVFVAMSAAVLLYLERVCVGVAEVYIREDLRIGKSEMEAAFGAFFIAYALGQVPSGWLSQRFGPRMMMTLYMLGWSLFGVFIALAQDFYTLFAARFLLGLSQAGAYPTAALLVKRWVPDRSRGLASGVVAFGGRFGGAGANWLTGILIVVFVPLSTPATVTPGDLLKPDLWSVETPPDKPYPEWQTIVRRAVADAPVAPTQAPDKVEEAVAKLNAVILDPNALPGLDWSELHLARDGRAILAKPAGERTPAESERLNRLAVDRAFPGVVKQLHGSGWRPSLMTYGVAGLVVGIFFWVCTRDWPRLHPWANAAEVEEIERGQSQNEQKAGTNAIPWRELVGSRNQWLFSATNLFGNAGWVFLITLMPRFLEERFGVPVDLRGLMTTLPLFFASFSLVAGGWVTDRLTQSYGPRWGRALTMGAAKVPCVVMMASIPWLPDPWLVTAALTVMAVFQDFGIPAVWAFAQDTGGKQVGAVIGWANMWGNLGAGLSLLLVKFVFERGGWDAVMYSGAGAFVLCTITGVMANAAEPLFKTSDPGKTNAGTPS
ncbi:MFS transporter [Fimbriiglobus ruber]|uniref:Putative glucarate transporter n=1 Tax=Fimbriiglobus ruber TaxID=1908690 RepID=A0A225E4I7_9BACT|nr:MFS transporter [Fimbriiglobus ruber]OWK44399.1 putative glucarate transporter [Fimbriiglobus ruber]